MKKSSAIVTFASAAMMALTMGMASPPAEAKVIIHIGVGDYFGWHYWRGHRCGWRNHRVKVWNKRHHRWGWTYAKRRHCR